MSVACVEREDFSSGTSSRSTKLIWGGSRYLVQAFVSLLSRELFLSPKATVRRFLADFKMVLNCHRERTFLLQQQPHLTSWLPIAVPLSTWIQWPPPFGFPLASVGPLGLFPLFFKFVRNRGSGTSQAHLSLSCRCLSAVRCTQWLLLSAVPRYDTSQSAEEVSTTRE